LPWLPALDLEGRCEPDDSAADDQSVDRHGVFRGKADELLKGTFQPMGDDRSKSKLFALVGAGGFIAPRHLKAIKELGGTLVSALDPNDSVGIIDSYFPEADFFTEVERFDRHLDKLRREGRPVDYVSICSPNYLHDAHIRMALRNGAHAICEKPIVLNPWNADALSEIEAESGKRVFTILQLRHHPAILALRKKHSAVLTAPHVVDVDVTYITSRGKWYHRSWKGSVEKSGGIATNIGVHFFDMLGWIFGGLQSSVVHRRQEDCASGIVHLERARVRWFLSVNSDHLPEQQKTKGQRTFRSIAIEGAEVEFSEGFTDLHTASYQEILAGRGYGLQDAKPSIEIVHAIRHAPFEPLAEGQHPMCRLVEAVRR
jgi:UDP-N-acetyl-2-amino-2-deoxyglucuronate dehydrogenase